MSTAAGALVATTVPEADVRPAYSVRASFKTVGDDEDAGAIRKGKADDSHGATCPGGAMNEHDTCEPAPALKPETQTGIT